MIFFSSLRSEKVIHVLFTLKMDTKKSKKLLNRLLAQKKFIFDICLIQTACDYLSCLNIQQSEFKIMIKPYHTVGTIDNDLSFGNLPI